MLPGGIRKNNPLNIRRSKDQWQGMRREQTDPAFCQFENLAYGWRAAFKLLTRTYYHTYRLFTIRAIVTKWAPPNENNTRAYVENVSRLTGIGPDEPLGIPSESPARWIALGAAMAIQENGMTTSTGSRCCRVGRWREAGEGQNDEKFLYLSLVVCRKISIFAGEKCVQQ